MEPKLIAENEWLIAVDKPAGLIVHSDGRTEEPTLVDWLLTHWPELKDVGEPWLSPQGESIARPGIVHRLDRTTSGIMIVAKTDEAWHYFKNEFRERRVTKTYHAFVYGVMESDVGRIVAEIDKGGTPKKWFAKDTTQDDVRAAITDWKLVRQFPDAAYLEVSPKTGRTHQIRVHLAHIGHPILVDHLYAADHAPLLGFTRPALHAYSIALTLSSGEKVEYAAPLPQDFLDAQKQ